MQAAGRSAEEVFMSFELTMLVWSVILTLAQMGIASFGALLNLGRKTSAGKRDRHQTDIGWAGRAQRAQRNMLESLTLFAVLVLVTETVNANNWMTGLGSEIFFGGRVAYAIFYIVGLPWLPAAAWAVSIAGLIVILAQLPLI
jgi:uncharacterized MAPEG superfamily protein